ncbi:unnamed protein product [Urochloa humidicola]
MGIISALRAWASPGPSNTLELALLTYVAAVMIGVLAESKDTVAGWNTATKAVYWATAVLAVALVGAGFMVVATERFKNPKASAFCAKLGAILSTALLIVAISCKFKPWGRKAGAPAAAVVAFVMVVVWVCAECRA